MPDLPSGTVTFLFTDIEGSTARWERDRVSMRSAVERHLEILRETVAAHGGALFKVIGDATQSAFAAAPDAVSAAYEAQRALRDESWDGSEPLRVRMALHAGQAAPRQGDYLAAPLNRLARLLAAAHGGQILVTAVVERLVTGDLPAGVRLRALGPHRLRDLPEPEEIFQVEAAELLGGFPPLRTAPAHATNLTVPPTALIGREVEVAAIERLFAEGARLVTLTGSGGTGKTRLALEVADNLRERFPDGVFFADLSPLRDAALVLPTVAAALGVRDVLGQAMRDTLVAYFSTRELLLVLDNCEQVLGAAPDVAALLAAAPRLVILATSREPLRLRAERDVTVMPLPLPAALPPRDQLLSVPSVALFVERARAARTDFALTGQNGTVIAAICQRLEGLPLAIELAAARMKVMTAEALLSRLERRLPLLTGGARDLPARQQTLRETIAWSYDLLTPAEQAMFRRLAVFSAGWTLEAAEIVGGEGGGGGGSTPSTLDGLTSLVEKSLIWLDETGSGPRYRMLETIREFGLEQLDGASDAAETKAAHAAWVIGLAEHLWTTMLHGPVTPRLVTQLESEIDNIRGAIGWLEETQDVDRLLLLTGSLYPFWLYGSYRAEGRGWVNQALRLPGAPDGAARLRALICAQGLAENSAARGDAITFGRETLALAERLDDSWAVGVALCQLGAAAISDGVYDEAEPLLAQAMEKFDARFDRDWIALALRDRAQAAYGRGDLDLALTRFAESLQENREIGDMGVGAIALAGLALVAMRRADPRGAAVLLRESLEWRREFPAKEELVSWLIPAASLAVRAGDSTAAARLLAAEAALREELGMPLRYPDRTDVEESVGMAKRALGEPAFAAAWQEGRTLTLEQAIRLGEDVLAGGSEQG